MRPIALVAILVGGALCVSGLLVIPLAINGFQYHRMDLLTSESLHISPLWGDPQSAVWLAPQSLAIRDTDPPSYRGHPHRVVNLSQLPIPPTVLYDWVQGLIQINVTGNPVNVYIVDEASLTNWEHGGSPWMVLAWDAVLGYWYVGWGFLREQLAPVMYLILEASNTTPPATTVSVSLTASWVPRTDAPDAALVAVPAPTLAEAAQDVRLQGNATCENGTRFDLTILERTSWEPRSQGGAGPGIFDGNRSGSYSFIVPLEPAVLQGASISFVVSNPGYSNLDIDVNLTAEIVWWEPPLAAARPFLGTLGGVLDFAGVAVVAAGVLLQLGPDPKRKPKG